MDKETTLEQFAQETAVDIMKHHASDCLIREKIAKHAKWLAGEPEGERASWKGLLIQHDELRGQDLRQADFRGCTIRDADLSFANLSRADFSAASWPHRKDTVGTQIQDSSFEGANLAGARLTDLQARHVRFLNASLPNADLSNSGFSHSDFEGADFRHTKLANTAFYLCDLKHASVDDSRLSVARIKESRLPDGTMHYGLLLETYQKEVAGSPRKKQTPPPATVQLAGFVCEIEQKTCDDGRTALILLITRDRKQVAVATIILPEAPDKAVAAFIRDYPKEPGLLVALEKAGIVRVNAETVLSGFEEMSGTKNLQPASTAASHDQEFTNGQQLKRTRKRRQKRL